MLAPIHCDLYMGHLEEGTDLPGQEFSDNRYGRKIAPASCQAHHEGREEWTGGALVLGAGALFHDLAQ